MELTSLTEAACAFLRDCPENRVSAADAIRPELAGMQIYDEPIFGVAAADDPLFAQLKRPEVVGEGVLLPGDWLAEAGSVLSFFLPFTARVRRSNRQRTDEASDEWLHARIEGQLMLNRLGAFLCGELERRGHRAVFPTTDPRFCLLSPLASNWSERHVAYICGLGTFGLSRGLITRKGVAGRFGSVVTSARLPVTARDYADPFAYCILCGACQRNCPARAIDVTRGVIDGKDQSRCAPFVRASYRPPHGPNQRRRYGCGKCQVGVPCESGVPLLSQRAKGPR